jgi:hypothetical protein
MRYPVKHVLGAQRGSVAKRFCVPNILGQMYTLRYN